MQAGKRYRNTFAWRRVMALLAATLLVACGSATSTSLGTPLNVHQLKFRVMDAVGTPVYCDPDVYPIARDGGQQANALTQYPKIQAQAALYAAIVAHEKLPTGDLTDAQKLTVYRAYKLLNAVVLTQDGNDYAFEFRAQPKTGTTIQMVKGSVRVDGA